MASVPPPTPRPDSPSGPFFVCPSCGGVAMDALPRPDHLGVLIADCLCYEGHVWTVRWIGAA